MKNNFCELVKCSKRHYYNLVYKHNKGYVCERKDFVSETEKLYFSHISVNTYKCEYLTEKGKFTILTRCISATAQLKVISWLIKFGVKQ